MLLKSWWDAGGVCCAREGGRTGAAGDPVVNEQPKIHPDGPKRGAAGVGFHLPPAPISAWDESQETSRGSFDLQCPKLSSGGEGRGEPAQNTPFLMALRGAPDVEDNEAQPWVMAVAPGGAGGATKLLRWKLTLTPPPQTLVSHHPNRPGSGHLGCRLTLDSPLQELPKLSLNRRLLSQANSHPGPLSCYL